IGYSLVLLSLLLSGQNAPPDRRIAPLTEAEAIFGAMDDQAGLLFTSDRLSLVMSDLGEHARAIALKERSLAFARQVGDKSNEAWALFGIGLETWFLGDHVRCGALCRDSLQLFRAIGDSPGEAYAYLKLGDLARVARHYEQAQSYYMASLTLQTEYHGMGDSYTLARLGTLAAAQQNPIRAAKLLGAAAAHNEIFGSPLSDLRDEFSSDVAAARARIGETAFNAAYAEGSRLTLEQATAYAFEKLNWGI